MEALAEAGASILPNSAQRLLQTDTFWPRAYCHASLTIWIFFHFQSIVSGSENATFLVTSYICPRKEALCPRLSGFARF